MHQMLRDGRIPMGDAESAALDALCEQHGSDVLSCARRDPNESGPLLVHIGDATWCIEEDGTAAEVSA